jgi:hypothetical protein
MEQDEVEFIEKRLAEDRGKYYRGTVRVRFEHLHFGKLCPRGRSDEIVEYLKDKFSHECLRLDPKNRIPAVIEPQTLDVGINPLQEPRSIIFSIIPVDYPGSRTYNFFPSSSYGLHPEQWPLYPEPRLNQPEPKLSNQDGPVWFPVQSQFLGSQTRL